MSMKIEYVPLQYPEHPLSYRQCQQSRLFVILSEQVLDHRELWMRMPWRFADESLMALWHYALSANALLDKAE